MSTVASGPARAILDRAGWFEHRRVHDPSTRSRSKTSRHLPTRPAGRSRPRRRRRLTRLDPGGADPGGQRIRPRRPPTSRPASRLYQQSYVNWAQQISIADVWTCTPSSAADVVTLANWAYQNGYSLRALGCGHNWSPLVLFPGENASNIVLVNTTDNLTSVSIDTSTLAGHGHRSGRHHDERADRRPAERRLRLHRHSRARRHHHRRRAGHRRARDVDPWQRGVRGARHHLRLAQQHHPVHDGRRLERERLRAADVQPHRSGDRAVPDPSGPDVRHRGNPRGRRQPEPAVPEPDLHLRQHPVRRAASSGLELVRQPGGRVRPGGVDLVPWHHLPVGEGLVPPAEPALVLQPVTSPYAYTFANSITTEESNLISEIVSGDDLRHPHVRDAGRVHRHSGLVGPAPGTSGARR